MPTREELEMEAGFEEGYDRVAYGVTRRELDELGEDRVRELMAKGKYGQSGSTSHSIVAAWLESREVQRKEEALATSKQALANSRRATWLATAALILSVIMAAQKIIEWYSK